MWVLWTARIIQSKSMLLVLFFSFSVVFEISVLCLNRNEILFTDCPKKAKNKEDNNTSNNIHVEVSFNLTAFVSWTTVILEGFCVMA